MNVDKWCRWWRRRREIYRHIHQGISVARTEIRWMSNKQHKTVRNGDTDRYPCCFMIGCWAEKPKHQHKSWIAFLSLSFSSSISVSLDGFDVAHSTATAICMEISTSSCTQIYTWNVSYFMYCKRGAIYTLQNGSNDTQGEAKLCLLCYICVLFFSILSRYIPLDCKCERFYLYLCSCIPFHVFFLRLCISLLVRLFILRAFVRPHLMSIVSILNFIDLMFVSYWVCFCLSIPLGTQCCAIIRMHKNDCTSTHRQSTEIS